MMCRAVQLKINDKILFNHLVIADSFFTRLKGWLGKNAVSENEALLIKPCRSVHSFGMKFTIDVLFINSEQVIVGIFENLEANHLTLTVKQADYVVEIKGGLINKLNIEIGQIIEICNNK